jgi:hypothetical protein
VVREIQGPNNQPFKPTPGTGQGGVRSGYEGHKGGQQGQGGKKAPEPEPEPPAEEDEEGHLDADSFARKRLGNDAKSFLTEERMPWEVASDERKKRLAESKQQRGTGPLSQARADARAPKGLPPRAPAAPPPQAKAPTGPLPPAAGRRVEAGWDANAAANSTLNAYQQLRDRQAERDKDHERDEAVAAEDAAAETAARLTRGHSLNRDAIAAARKGEPEAEEPTSAGPSWRVEPSLAPEPPVRPPVPRAPLSPTGPLAPRPGAQAEPPRPAAPKLKTGSLGSPMSDKPAAGGRGATPDAGAARDGARREPLARGPILPSEAAQPEAPAPAEPVVPFEAVAPAEAPAWTEPEAVPDVVAAAPDLPVADDEPRLEDLIAEEPMLQDILARVPGGKLGNRVVCHYQVVDVGTKKPLAGARLEFEPVQDDRLPVINGQTDFDGLYKGENIAAGFYQVTVRSPGYIPQMQTHYIKAGEVDEGVFLLKKP